MNSISVASTKDAESSQILQTTLSVLGNYESHMRRAIR